MISIIIRTKNEEQYLEKCLIALRSQNFDKKIEIILIDNESLDNTVKIAKQYKCKVFDYPKSTKFNFSKAINIGIKKSKSEIISILSAHCVPFDNYWIYNAFKHFQDPEIGAVYSRQLPTDNSKNNDYRDGNVIVPLGIIFRCLGITTDKQIIQLIIKDNLDNVAGSVY